MGDLTSGTTQNFSNAELEAAYQEANTGKVGRASAKLSFEAELSILAYEYKRKYLDNTDIDLTRSIVFIDMLESFYKEAEKLKNAQRI
jgi:hypothetical protein